MTVFYQDDQVTLHADAVPTDEPVWTDFADVPLPERIQRKRTRGWRMPEGAIYVGRPTKWGNPITLVNQHAVIDEWGDTRYAEPGAARGLAVRLYRELLMDGRLDIDPADVINELAGHDLACWCPLDQPCHADVLVEIANAELQRKLEGR